MQNLEIQKRKIESYFGTRKYKLSFWGFNTHIDWYGLLVYFLIVFGILMWVGYTKLENTKAVMNEESAVVGNRDNAQVDIRAIEELLDKQYTGVTVVNDRLKNLTATSSISVEDDEIQNGEEVDVGSGS